MSRDDLRHAVRRLIRDWRFTAGAVLILGLGVGANTAIFSVVNATLFRESQLVRPDRVVEIYQNGADGQPAFSSYPAFTDMTTYTQLFAGLTAPRRQAPMCWPAHLLRATSSSRSTLSGSTSMSRTR